MSDEVIVKPNKLKVVLIILLSIVMVSLALYLLIAGQAWANNDYQQVFIFALSLLMVSFFGLILVYSLIKLFDKNPGLVINESGIFDNSSSISAGLIQWPDIKDVTITSDNSKNYLTVIVNEPEKYLQPGHWLQDFAAKSNIKYYGSPIHISTGIKDLKVSFDQLEKTLATYMEKSQHSQY